MKKLALLSAVASLGLLGLSASAKVPQGYSSLNVSAVVLTQNTEITGAGTSATVTKTKITDDDILQLIDDEFDTSYSKADGGSGYQLLVNNFWDGSIYVADKDGDVEGYYGSSSDEYELNIGYDEDVYTGKENSNETGSEKSTAADAEIYYQNYNNTESFEAEGLGTVSDNYGASSSSESFKVSSMQGDGYFDSSDVIISGSMSGSGKDNVGP